jgi:hypothetical protein
MLYYHILGIKNSGGMSKKGNKVLDFYKNSNFIGNQVL